MKIDSFVIQQSDQVRARDISKKIALRLCEPESVYAAVHAEHNVSPETKYHPWGETSLSHGYPGNIHLLSQWRATDPSYDWNRAIHSNMAQIQSSLAKNGLHDLSLYSGWAGIASSVREASNHGKYYSNFLQQIHQWMMPLTEQWLQSNTEKLSLHEGMPMQAFDTISGASGIGRYILMNSTDPICTPLVEPILQFLTDLTHPIHIHNRYVPGWYSPQKFQFLDRDKRNYPLGNFNCGMAHGIPGPLALLSVAYSAGIEVKGQYQAIETIAEWLLKYKYEDEYGSYWPHIVPFEAETGSLRFDLERAREAWCYGTPGIACTLFLAGRALHNEELQKLAVKACVGAISYEIAKREMDSSALCHGLAGLLTISWRMWCHSKEPAFLPLIQQLTNCLLDRFQMDSPLGYLDPEPRADGSLVWLTKAGMLEGVAGIAAALLSVSENKEIGWDYILMLS
ncbi:MULTISPECIES: lanthionine synthetase C family protein [Paenibacillus]|uniref:lanthionine synthetase C family protein n=1 Tax=Paenibacillus TaxID=44249 RepID=UPI00048CBB3E|nr:MULTISPECIES: lanthionine synthetase C family protein [Paenibacillus]APB76819.1 lantibiotic biosynthesis protein [Paenibacillus polymyxa]OMF75389.1 lantibiotic biosynthesis protein [Paenibacillus peoriae]OMF82523.1 lantibiotic biosynthesis protein [Paenibacillus peoriae]POR30008.1 lantibiotic biosynthesis protein [Paenibacillus polymyxa]SFR00075.1 Lanthionine synthetase C-like protein [Paenibacillus sp. cl130]